MKMMKSIVSCINLKLVGAIFVLLHFHLLFSNYTVGAVVADSKHVPSASGGCIEKERHALLELKESMVLDDTSLLTTWDSKSHDCCAWERIVCSNQTGHVEMLDLNGYDKFIDGLFRGEINASLIGLGHLKYLNLSINLLSNSIFPYFFGSLSNLRFLDLHGSFDGGRIPNDLALLSHLQYLDLSSNYIEGTIPHQLGNLSHLQYLGLSGNHLVGTIPHQLGRLSNLRGLHLGFNEGLKVEDDKNNNDDGGEWLSNLTLLTHLDLRGVRNLFSSQVWLQMIAKLPNLQELSLSNCDLSDLHLFSLSRSLFNFSTSLTTLDLSYNTFSSSEVFEWVFNATSNLTDLHLSGNNFKGTISYDFGNIKNPLELLDLSSNELQGGIPKSIGDICTLHSLNLDDTNLNEDISIILLNLSGCARYSLQYLWLNENQITGILPNLSIFPSLITIDLSSNLLSGKVPDGIPQSLESFMFHQNSLEGGIPKSFGNLCSLRLIDLSSNKLSEDLSMILHNLSVGCAKYSLQNLELGGNQITGKVNDISEFSFLESLDLSYNNLEGVVTDSHFVNMSMLKELSLSFNSLTLKFNENWVPPFQMFVIYLSSLTLGPTFPKWLKSQKHLQFLDISDAQIADVVPVWFWTQTTHIVVMNISYNNLIGIIPNLPIRAFKQYSEIIMDSNQFEGSIPPFFRRAGSLRLSKNKFSDIHLLLCTNAIINNLLLLDISKNQLSTQLFGCWSHLKALEFLDLSDNSLSGEVPSSMASLSKLKVLILRNNSLAGKLPVSLKNCTNLVMLDLGDNRLSGPIPYWLGEQLQMLSLRRNQFYGSLPQSLCYLTNIQLLDLSENNLSGQILKCLKNFSAMSQQVSSINTIDFDLVSQDGYAAFSAGSFDLIALLMWKGTERLFKNNELILRSIDLSSNHLIGNLPEEIGNLVGLVSLNLSNNNLSGEIPSKIGKLTLLEFLDLSTNHFSGLIPPSLAQIDRLSMLNLSDNNLSGRIPIGTQLQGFDASSYEGNADLCGKPLNKTCPRDEEHQKPETSEKSTQEDRKAIYLSVALGFITGFWGLWGSLFLSRNWRHKYVLFLNNIIDTMYVFIMLNATKFRAWLRGLQEKFV